MIGRGLDVNITLVTLTLQKNRHDRSAGETGISFGAEPSNVRHDPPLPLLDLTFGEVLHHPPI